MIHPFLIFMGIVFTLGSIILGGLYVTFWFKNRKIKGTITVKGYKGQELVYMKTYKDQVVNLRLLPEKNGSMDRMEIT